MRELFLALSVRPQESDDLPFAAGSNGSSAVPAGLVALKTVLPSSKKTILKADAVARQIQSLLMCQSGWWPSATSVLELDDVDATALTQEWKPKTNEGVASSPIEAPVSGKGEGEAEKKENEEEANPGLGTVLASTTASATLESVTNPVVCNMHSESDRQTGRTCTTH